VRDVEAVGVWLDAALLQRLELGAADFLYGHVAPR
jgi:hypothetical protein